MFKGHAIKSTNRVLGKTKVDTYRAADYSATDLAAKICTNSNEHSM
jgi:hypothetical protein